MNRVMSYFGFTPGKRPAPRGDQRPTQQPHRPGRSLFSKLLRLIGVPAAPQPTGIKQNLWLTITADTLYEVQSVSVRVHGSHP